MDSRLIELGKRAVACEVWRWMPGMRPMRCWSGVDWTPAPSPLTHRRSPYGPPGNQDYDWPHDLALCIPDLSDPATLGCLEALVLEAYEGRVSMQRAGTWWRVCARNEWDDRCTQSYAEALVCALEAAQEVERG